MSKRALTILIAAVLVVGAAAAVVATSLGTGSGGAEGHRMPGGQTMQGAMPAPAHEMKDGSTMDGADMK